MLTKIVSVTCWLLVIAVVISLVSVVDVKVFRFVLRPIFALFRVSINPRRSLVGQFVSFIRKAMKENETSKDAKKKD